MATAVAEIAATVTWEAIAAVAVGIIIVAVVVAAHQAAHQAAQTLEEVTQAQTSAATAVEDLAAKTLILQQDSQTSKQETQE